MQNKKRLFTIFAFLPFLLLGCSKNERPSESETPEIHTHIINPVSPSDGQTISLANKDVTEFVENYTFSSSSDYVQNYNHYESETSLTLSWTIEEVANYYIVDFSEDKDLAVADHYLTNITSVEIDGVFPGKTYYWRVNAYFTTKIVRSYVFTVETLSMPTTIYLESVGPRPKFPPRGSVSRWRCACSSPGCRL